MRVETHFNPSEIVDSCAISCNFCCVVNLNNVDCVPSFVVLRMYLTLGRTYEVKAAADFRSR